MTPTIYDAAVYYVETLGVSVVPVITGQKRPSIPWVEYQQRRPTPDELVAWFHPEIATQQYQLGIVCGAVSGNLVALDFETPESYKEWKARHPIESQTRTHQTGKGVHVLLRLDSVPVGNRKLIENLVETRGEGGQVLAPPSLHPSGKHYKLMLGAREIKTTTWAAISQGEQWIGSNGERGRAGAVDVAQFLIAGENSGERNDTIFDAAVFLRDAGKSDKETLQTLLDANERNDPPLDDKEIARTVQSAFSRPPRGAAALPTLEAIMAHLSELREKQNSAFMQGEAKPPDTTPEIDAILKKSGRLEDDEIDTVLTEVKRGPFPLSTKTKTVLKKAWRTAHGGAKILQAKTNIERPETWPYAQKNGRIVFLTEKTTWDDVILQTTPVCDFTAKIETEITEEGGSKTFVITGAGRRGGPFGVEIDAEDFGNDRKLKAVLDAAAGARDPVHARQGGHLGPAIKLLTREQLKSIKRFRRTGWQGGRFLIPGREPRGVEIELARKLPYSIDKKADLTLGIQALDALLQSMGSERSTMALSLMLQAPVARLVGWENERYCLFITGRTGSLKTSFAQMLMCMYGKDFAQDSLLVKWGEGATRTAMIIMASKAHDMPLLIDNYKPNTGGGARDFVNLIHSIVEGGDKDRANRNAELRETALIYCWPICTGEDIPNVDPASLARILVVPFAWQKGEPNHNLTTAQRLSDQLSAVGEAWISWLESEGGREACVRIAGKFEDLRTEWALKLGKMRSDISNPNRIASNLATNQLTFEMLCAHPSLGELGEKYRESHTQGLENTALEMSTATAEALEASKFVSALKELLTTGRAVLLPRNPEPQQLETDKEKEERNKDRVIGWRDDLGVYLLVNSARQAVERLLGFDALAGMSMSALYKQMADLGFFPATPASVATRYTRVLQMRGQPKRVCHLNPDTFEDEITARADKETAQKEDEIPF